jgi:hypothetical protein
VSALGWAACHEYHGRFTRSRKPPLSYLHQSELLRVSLSPCPAWRPNARCPSKALEAKCSDPAILPIGANEPSPRVVVQDLARPHDRSPEGWPPLPHPLVLTRCGASPCSERRGLGARQRRRGPSGPCSLPGPRSSRGSSGRDGAGQTRWPASYPPSRGSGPPAGTRSVGVRPFSGYSTRLALLGSQKRRLAR